MSETPTGAQPGAGTPTDQPGGTTPAAPPAAPAAPPGAGTAPAKTYTQEEFDGATAAARKRAEGEARAAAKTAGELQAERDALFAEKQAREQTEMTELERAKAQADELTAKVVAAEAVAAEATRRLYVEQAVRTVNPSLPTQFLATITATDPEEITAAVTAANEEWTALLAQHAKGATPPPQSVGASSNPPGQAPANLRGSAEIAKELAACMDTVARNALFHEWEQARQTEQAQRRPG